MSDSPLLEFLRSLRAIHVARGEPAVAHTLAAEILDRLAPKAKLAARKPAKGPALLIAAGDSAAPLTRRDARLTFALPTSGVARLESRSAVHLYAFFHWLLDVDGKRPLQSLALTTTPTFLWRRPVWDLYFAQAARSIRGLDPEEYVRAMARGGFTHLEVNRLAAAEGRERGVPGEVYPRFYTYCPALDQFVDSFLNRGIYPRSALDRNLAMLQRHSALAEKYGLVPSMTCFEPRTVPDRLLERYPELRGARVDHPFRSFHPRYNLAVSHPVVQRHYRELVQNLLRAVPNLAHLSVWSNDSGAGFEFTPSLYAGANGSAYLVREWSEAEVFTRSAAKNATDFLRLLQEAGREIQPAFRVATRLEPFRAERPHVLAALGRGLDVETASLHTLGWESRTPHPRYGELRVNPCTIFANRFPRDEAAAIQKLRRRGCLTHVYHAHGPVNNFEPLLGIPAPWLTLEKLRALHGGGSEHLAHFGGVAPPRLVPYPVNDEVARRFQHQPDVAREELIAAIAEHWAGPQAAHLLKVWKLTEQAIRGFHPNFLYSLWGVWYRILVRPLVPDIEAIPAAERAYYEDHLLATHHNPNRVDLSRDILFHLMAPREAATAARRIDRHALPPLCKALAVLRQLLAQDALDSEQQHLFEDQLVRLRALLAWMTTRRSIAVWNAEVPRYAKLRTKVERHKSRARLRAMVKDEIANARELLDLARSTRVAFMAISKGKETTFIYDREFPAHLGRKIALMEQYGDREPRIDPGIVWRVRNASW